MKRSQIIFITVTMAFTVFCGNAYAQGSPGARDSLCIHFSGDSRDLLIELRRGVILSGTVPLTLCDLQPGLTYDMTVRGRGFEVRRGYLSLDGNGVPSIGGNRLGTFARNLLPGWGSIHAERKDAGWSDLISIAATGMLALREHNEYKHIETRYNILMAQIEVADNVEERQKIRIDANKASRDLNVQNAYRKRCLGYMAYMYAFQLIDPWIVGNPPKTKVTAGGSVVEISGSGASTAKAAILSLFLPGRGQFYQGKRSRGVFFSLATTAGVLISLDYLNTYEEAVNAYELNVEYFETAENVEDKEYFSSRSGAYWADVEKTRRWRNISYGILAGIWAAGVIDTFIPGREDAPPSDLSFNVGPNHASLVYRF
jgi:hypothetical protein